MRILLANSPGMSYLYKLGVRWPPLGLAYIGAVLSEQGYEVKIADFDIGGSDWSTYPYKQFDIVGISTETIRYPKALQVAQLAKEQGAIVVMGGPHVTFFDKETLESGVVDYVVRNEGEDVMLALVNCLTKKATLNEVKGISYLDNGKLVRNPDAPYIGDLDALPFPARDLLPLKLYGSKLKGRLSTSMSTSRGCPYNCYFCSASQFAGVKWRARSVESMLEEIEVVHKRYGFNALHFVDDNFTLNPERVTNLCEEIIRRNWDIFWWAMSRVDTIVGNPDMIEVMARAGLKRMFVGFESASQRTLDGYGKKTNVSDAKVAMQILKKNKVEVVGSFILGGLYETKEDVEETIRFANQLGIDSAQFGILTPYPGTNLYKDVENRLLSKNWRLFTGSVPSITLNYLSSEEVARLFIKANLSFYLHPKKIALITSVMSDPAFLETNFLAPLREVLGKDRADSLLEAVKLPRILRRYSY
jgi:anaerobic magnesium-protoporphyrin IX monomethyl ester cyclase